MLFPCGAVLCAADGKITKIIYCFKIESLVLSLKNDLLFVGRETTHVIDCDEATPRQAAH